MVILSWWLVFIASRFPHLSPNIMTEEKGIGATEVFDYENTRSDFNKILLLLTKMKII